MAASVETFVDDQHNAESESHVSPMGDLKVVLAAFAVFIVFAAVWMGFFFGVLQPWLDSAYL